MFAERRPSRLEVLKRGALPGRLRASWEFCPEMQVISGGSIHGLTGPVFRDLFRPNDPAFMCSALNTQGPPTAARAPPAAGLQQIGNNFEEGVIGAGEWGLYSTTGAYGMTSPLVGVVDDPSYFTLELGIIQAEVAHGWSAAPFTVGHQGGPTTQIYDAGWGSAGYAPLKLVSGIGSQTYTASDTYSPLFLVWNGARIELYDLRMRTNYRPTLVTTNPITIDGLLSAWEGWLTYARLYNGTLSQAMMRELIARPWSALYRSEALWGWLPPPPPPVDLGYIDQLAGSARLSTMLAGSADITTKLAGAVELSASLEGKK